MLKITITHDKKENVIFFVHIYFLEGTTLQSTNISCSHIKQSQTNNRGMQNLKKM